MQLDLLPHPGELLSDVGGFRHLQLGIAVYLDIAEHRVAAGGRQLRAAALLIGALKMVVGSRERVALVVRPLLARGLAQRLLQKRVAALLAELDKVHLAALVELHKLVIELHLLARSLGHDADDMTRYREGVEELEHADALVALLNVVAVHVLIRLDRLADALGQMRLAQAVPLVGEFRALLEKGHKVGGKGIDPAAGLGADNQLGGDLHHAEIYPHGDGGGGNEVVQHGQAGRFALEHTRAGFLLSQLESVLIIVFIHIKIPLF